MSCILVTGGAGFIGSNFVRYLVNSNLYHTNEIVVVDKLTYAGNIESLNDIKKSFTFIKADIANRRKMQQVIKKYDPVWVVNFAAETHVDRSIDGPDPFIHSNILGVYELLEACRLHNTASGFRFLHVSTDEVYGSLSLEDPGFTETTPYDPSSPYSASKASADHLVSSYFRTFQFPTLITNCSNNYGPYQYPEKLIPLVILNAIEGKPLPIYGKGDNVRDWLYVEDHCDAIYRVLTEGTPGEKYNIGGGSEQTNLDIVNQICDILDWASPDPFSQGGFKHSSLIEFVEDRPGHDQRYAIDYSKIKNELSWEPRYDFSKGLVITVLWYLHNRQWCQMINKRR